MMLVLAIVRPVAVERRAEVHPVGSKRDLPRSGSSRIPAISMLTPLRESTASSVRHAVMSGTELSGSTTTVDMASLGSLADANSRSTSETSNGSAGSNSKEPVGLYRPARGSIRQRTKVVGGDAEGPGEQQ